MHQPISYELLEKVAEAGILSIQDAVGLIDEKSGSYVDFMPLAILLHAGYIETDTENSFGREKVKAKFGFDTKSIAENLALVATPEGKSRDINGIKQQSWSSMEAYVFITAPGALRLEEFYEKRKADQERNTGYRVAILTAVLSSMISAVLAAWISK
ncbi:hypothetical protein ACNFIA_13180 [Pseudomonas sp. NY15437]|uniref:hypothetical protein n=1 Tax=Pseudomonas sp. NY15437 TaxID=3400360 RepID=UPI003A88B0ED